MALFSLIGTTGWVQHLRWISDVEEGAGFRVALPQRCVANFMILVLTRICLNLSYAALDVLVVVQDLSDSQGPGFVDWGRLLVWFMSISGMPCQDSRPSAMALGLVCATVRLGIEKDAEILTWLSRLPLLSPTARKRYIRA